MKVTQDQFDEILQLLTCSDKSLRSILASYNITYDQFYSFVNVSEETKLLYQQSREKQANYLADLMIEDSAAIDPINYQCAKTKFEIRRWLLSKMHPKMYADNSSQVNIQVNAVQPTLTIALHPEKQKTGELNTLIDSSITKQIDNK